MTRLRCIAALTAIALAATLAACGQQSQQAADKAKESASKAADSAVTATKDAATAASAAAKDATNAAADAAKSAADATKDAAAKAARCNEGRRATRPPTRRRTPRRRQATPRRRRRTPPRKPRRSKRGSRVVRQRPSRDGRFHSSVRNDADVATQRDRPHAVRRRDARRPFVPAGIALARSTSVAPGRRFPVQRVELPLLSVNRRNHLPLPLPAAFRRRVRATPCNAACMHVVYTRQRSRVCVVPQTVADPHPRRAQRATTRCSRIDQ